MLPPHIKNLKSRSTQAATMPDASSIIQNHTPNLTPYEDLYRTFHANPELSFQEHDTSSRIRSRLQSHHSSFTLTDNIGGTGLCAILRNGDGPTILLRADIDGLPVQETTGLAYASTKRATDRNGKEQPTMHACGHDMHIASLLAAGELLSSAKDSWSGTLILLFQPAEEIGSGAQAMIDDGLYDSQKHNVPIPDLVIGAHVMPLPVGTLGARSGVMASYADSFRIRIHGKGGHASQPHRSIDPVIVASHVTVRLQTLVSREIDPQDPAVVSVTSLQAGEAHNIIPEFAVLLVNTRTFTAEVRERVLSGIRRIVKAECVASDCIKDPQFEMLYSYPVLMNDDTATERLAAGMRQHFGDEKWRDDERLKGSEDFGILATAVEKPSVYYAYGGVDVDEWEKNKGDVPGNHSSSFAPVLQPTLKIATEAYAVAALRWLSKGAGDLR